MSDNSKRLKCPACDSLMTKVYIKEHNLHVDICVDGCGGIFFDNGEYKLFDEQCENIDKILEALEGKNTNKAVIKERDRICPVCGAKMVQNFSSITQNIKVDDCYICGGKFLDNNELQQVRAEYQNDEQRSEDVMAYLYQHIG